MQKTILITGASTGIGRAAALHFAGRGWNVAATMRRPDAAKSFPRLANLSLFPLDVTDDASIAAIFPAVLAKFGAVDVLLNNAGYGLFGAFEALEPEQMERQFRTNVFGLMAMMRGAIPHMRERKSGLIINVSSIGGRIGFPLASAYHATKFAVEGLTEAMRFELKPHGVRVKLIEPGGIKTDFVERSLEFATSPHYAVEQDNYRRLLKQDRLFARPEQVAQVIYRAATDGSDKLRYPAKPGPFLALRHILPDIAWRGMLNAMIHRQPSTAAGS